MRKVSEMEGADLDRWVAKANELEPRIGANGECYTFYGKYSPSTDWSKGGPIIEREKIKLEPMHDITKGFVKWSAKAVLYKYPMSGPTALIAAMRFYVANKFSEEVDDS